MRSSSWLEAKEDVKKSKKVENNSCKMAFAYRKSPDAAFKIFEASGGMNQTKKVQHSPNPVQL